MINELQSVPQPFPPHKVMLKATGISSPSIALSYIMSRWEDIPIIVNKQRERSIVITIYCSEEQYKLMKLYFVRDMGCDFIWKEGLIL